MEITEEHVEFLKNVLIDHVPYARAIGMEVINANVGKIWLKVPYQDKLVGDPDTGVLHGGVITSVLDNAGGIAVQLSMPQREAIATLDLRIDYMRAATPKLDLMAHAHCYKLTRNIAFVRGSAYDEDPDDPIATFVATFMRGANRSTPIGGEKSDIEKMTKQILREVRGKKD